MLINVATLAYHLNRTRALSIFYDVEHKLELEIHEQREGKVVKRSFDLCKAAHMAEIKKVPRLHADLMAVANKLRIKIC